MSGKNRYMIVKHCDNGKELQYNEDCNIFAVKHGTIYTNKRKAAEKLKYACKYASGCETPGKTEVVIL